MMLDKKITFANIDEMPDSLRKANIKRSDLLNPTYETDPISEYSGTGKINMLEDDKKLRKYEVPLENLEKEVTRIFAYDESFQKFKMLQGTLSFTAHALIECGEKDYDYTCHVTSYFLTRAKKYSDIKIAIVCEEPENEFKKQYLADRYNFLLDMVPNDSILLIDGPLIGAQSSSRNIQLVKELMKKNIVPVFYVKNSHSTMLLNTLDNNIRSHFNSDLDFSNNFLSLGQRTSFVLYKDDINESNQKVFTYTKFYKGVPQRLEIHPDTYLKNKDMLGTILSLLYFYSMLHGDMYNPQIRPVAIAERFARESLRFLHPSELASTTGLSETMNAMRSFG